MTSDNNVRKRSRRSSRTLPAEEKRNHTVSSRFNKVELAQLDEDRVKVNMTRGEFVRLAVLGKLPSPVPEINKKTWKDLGKVGANLNQISKKLNEGDSLGDNIDDLRGTILELRTVLLKG